MNKKPKIMIATNIFQIDPIVYASHLDMFYKLGQAKDEFDIIFFGPWRSGIDAGRNNAAKYAMKWECDYLLFYDDDMYFDTGNDIVKLIRTIINNSKIHVLQANAFIRGYPFLPMCFKIEKVDDLKRMAPYDDYADNVDENGLVKCDAVGCCATIIDVNLFKMIPEPWFVTGKEHTEDVYFCVKVAQFIEGAGIYMDSTIKIGHLCEKIILNEGNKKMLKELYEKYKINQLFLPDPEFASMMQNMHPFEKEERVNPLEVKDSFFYKKEEK
jgi:glycosyltransferase involved in cell wall biosynthesis